MTLFPIEAIEVLANNKVQRNKVVQIAVIPDGVQDEDVTEAPVGRREQQ